MKKLQYYLTFCFSMFLLLGCTEEDNDTQFINNIPAPSNLSVSFRVTADNSGLVTLTPNGDGVTEYQLFYGDGGDPAVLSAGETIDHIYAEGSYEVRLIGKGINGLTAEITQPLNVAFIAPQNLVVTIENDGAVSNTVRVNATAEFGINYEVDFGEEGDEDIRMANMGDEIIYEYQAPGFYTITVTAFSAAIETTQYVEENFEVTAIVQPLASATTPPARAEGDVIGVFSEAYAYDENNDFFPYWGQVNEGYAANMFDLDGDLMLQYTNLSYQGIQLASSIDASGMEMLHLDVWTPDAIDARISPISPGPNETAYDLELEAETWTRFDIPLSFFTDQNPLVDLSEIIQFKFDGVPSGEGTIFVDNIYFWKEPTEYVALISDDFEGNGNITNWTGDALTIDTAAPNVVNESINTSLTIMEYVDNGSGQFANAQFTADGKFDLSGSNTVFALKIYVPSSSITGSQPNQVSLKLQNSDLGGNSWQTQTEIIKPLQLDTWQLVTFDFRNDNWINLNFNGPDPDPVDRTDLDKVVIQVNSENNFDAVTAYIDDFAYGPMLPEELPPFAMDDFEGNGNITNWTGDAAGIDTALPNPIDPNVAGINYSDTVLFYEDTGGQFANIQFTVDQKFDMMDKNKFTLKVYVPSSSITGSQPNQISLKLQNSDLGGNSWQTQTEIVKPIVLDQWQQLTFDFVNDNWQNLNFNGPDPDPVDRTDLDKVVIQLNSENNNDAVSGYIDDFKYHK